MNFLAHTSHFIPFFPPLCFGLSVPQTHCLAHKSVIWCWMSNQVSGYAVLRACPTPWLSTCKWCNGSQLAHFLSLTPFSCSRTYPWRSTDLVAGEEKDRRKEQEPKTCLSHFLWYGYLWYWLQLLIPYFILGRSCGWKNGGGWARVGIKRDRKQIQHFDKLDAKTLWSIWSK